jgi:hypothetical protein
VLTERVLAALGFRRDYRMVLALLLAAGALTSGWWLALLLSADVLACGLLVLPWLLGRKWNPWSVVVGLGLGGFVFLSVASVLFTARSAAPQADYRATSLATEAKESTRGPANPTAPKVEDPAGGPAYQGLPAKFTMPSGTSHSYFTREMLSTRSRAVRVVMLSRPVLSVAGQLLIALALLLLALQWKTLRRGVEERWQKVGRARRPAENS